MDIEKIATSSIENLISRNSYLKPIINNNDKTPVWDGDVFVYRTKDIKEKNEDLIGRVPVQVKGHKVEDISILNLKDIKFRVKYEDMKKYLTDGGVIYFVVCIDEKSELIFYNSLLPLDLSRLIKRYDKQKTFEIEFKSLPTSDIELADIFLDFIQNRKKQQGTLIPEVLYINDIENIRNEIKNFKFSYSTVEPKESNPFKELTTRDFYVYAEPKGIGNPIPFDKISNAIINIEDKFKIALDKTSYYEDAFIQWENGQPRIICGKAVKLNMIDTDNSEIVYSNLEVDFKGTLNEQLNDLNFIKGLSLNKELIIDSYHVPYDNFKFDDTEGLYSRISDLEKLKQRLEYYGVKKDFELDSITREDDSKLSLLMDDKPSIKRYNIDLTESHIFNIQIANIVVLLKVDQNLEQGYYSLNSFFSNIWEFSYGTPEKSERIPMSQFLILDKKGLLVDNIDSQRIIDDIKRRHATIDDNNIINLINKFLLEAIMAYDECSSQQNELKYLIENLSEWFYNQIQEDYIFLNLAQVKYRLGILDKDDIYKIIDIGSFNKDNIEIQVATSILLNKEESAKTLIATMNQEQKELFMSYPIYHLLEKDNFNNIDKNMESI